MKLAVTRLNKGMRDSSLETGGLLSFFMHVPHMVWTVLVWAVHQVLALDESVACD